MPSCAGSCLCVSAQNRIQGFGSNSPSGGGGSYDAPAASDGGTASGSGVGGSGKRMEGFGNPRYASGGGSGAAARTGHNSIASAAWGGAMSVSGTALSGVGTALSGASR